MKVCVTSYKQVFFSSKRQKNDTIHLETAAHQLEQDYLSIVREENGGIILPQDRILAKQVAADLAAEKLETESPLGDRTIIPNRPDGN